MTGFRQARWNEPPIFEVSREKSRGRRIPYIGEDQKMGVDVLTRLIPENLLRRDEPNLPALSEVDVVRHFTRLSQANFGVDNGVYPPRKLHHEVQPQNQ